MIWGTISLPQSSCTMSTTTNSDTLYIPHFQLPSRPQEAYWWQHFGPCLHHQDQSAQGKRRSPHCKDLWQVAIESHMDPYTWTALQCSISVVMLIICRAPKSWLGLTDQFSSWVSSIDLRDSRVLLYSIRTKCYLCTKIFVSLVGVPAFRLTLIVFFCSPDMPESEATFAITGGGIADAKE